MASGSSFRVYLPVSGEAGLPQQDDAIEQAGSAKDGGTVMLIEDDELMREMASTMLIRLGYTVLPLENGIEALRKFRKQPNAISVVLCDLSMPHLNGWETLAALRQIRPDIPVILASGYEDIPPPEQGCSERPQVILKKPYHKKVLRDALTKAMKK